MSEIRNLIQQILRFRDERDWAQYHKPKELAAALSIEVAELQELFLWLENHDLEEALSKPELQKEARREIGDVLIYALLLCHELGIDPVTAVENKLEENRKKYPADLARGSAAKYTKLQRGQGDSD